MAGIRDVTDFLMKGIGGPPKTISSLSDKFPPNDWNTPLILAVDEAQNLPPDRRIPRAEFAQALHNASHGLPILPVFAGPGDLRNVLQDTGLSRPEHVHEIGCLTPEERTDYLQWFRAEFGLTVGGDADIVRENLPRLLDDTEG